MTDQENLCAICDLRHDVRFDIKSNSKGGGDKSKYICATYPWYSIDQIFRLFGINQSTMRSHLQDGGWMSFGHKVGGKWIVHIDDLLIMIQQRRPR